MIIKSTHLYEVAKILEDYREEFLCFALYEAINPDGGDAVKVLREAQDFVAANKPEEVKLCLYADGTPGTAWDAEREFKINWALQQAARLKREELLAGEAHG